MIIVIYQRSNLVSLLSILAAGPGNLETSASIKSQISFLTNIASGSYRISRN